MVSMVLRNYGSHKNLGNLCRQPTRIVFWFRDTSEMHIILYNTEVMIYCP